MQLPASLAIPTYKPGPPPFEDGETLVYQASWIGIPAAEARVRLHHDGKQPQQWTGEMWITSSKVVDLAYRMRDYIREDFDRGSLVPQDMYILQHEKKRIDRWQVKFDRPGHLIISRKTNRQGRLTMRWFSGGEPWGPFSGATLALSQPLAVGDELKFDVFSGGNRYIFGFNVISREKITTALGTFDALRIEPAVLWLSEGKFRSQVHETTIWVTADEHHVPLRIDSAVFIGNVRADLVKVIDGPPIDAESGAEASGHGGPAGGKSPRAPTRDATDGQ
jgi:Protein of unknown function (DUF3108)